VIAAAQSLAARVLEAPPAKLQASGPGLPGDSPVLIIGRTAQVAALLRRLGLPPAPSQVAAKGSARVWAGRDDSGRSYAVIAAEQADGLQAVARPLPHYGRESWLVFEHAKAVDKGIWPPRVERIRVEASALAGQIPAFGVQ
jgi:aminopeptidase N